MLLSVDSIKGNTVVKSTLPPVSQVVENQEVECYLRGKTKWHCLLSFHHAGVFFQIGLSGPTCNNWIV